MALVDVGGAQVVAASVAEVLVVAVDSAVVAEAALALAEAAILGAVVPLVAGKERRMWQRLLTTFKQRWMDESDTRRVIAPDLA